MLDLTKYDNEFKAKLIEQLNVYVTIGGKNESPMWFQFVEHKHKENKLFFRSSQVDYMFFHIDVLPEDQNQYFEYATTYDHFRELKYKFIKDNYPTVYYQIRPNEKPIPNLPEITIPSHYDHLEVPEVSDYQIQALDFLKATGTTFAATFKDHDYYFPEDKQTRDIYYITLKNKSHKYRFTFGQSISNSGNAPTPYDVLACLTKYDVGNFDNFCGDFGYDVDSRKAYKIYKAVLREWKNVELLFTTDQLEQLQEIN